MPLNRSAIGREVPGHGDGQAAAIAKGQERLDLPFAKAGAAQELRAIVVLQGTSQNFAGTGCAAIDQGEHGAIKEPADVGRTLLINAVAVLGFNNHIASEEVVGNGQPGAH